MWVGPGGDRNGAKARKCRGRIARSKVFRRNGLQQFWEATCATARYRHLDFMLSQRLAGRFWFPNVPFVFTTTHKSVIYGKGERRTRRGNAYRERGAAVKKLALILKFSMVV